MPRPSSKSLYYYLYTAIGVGPLLQFAFAIQELSKVAGLQKKVEEVKGIMVDNIEQVPKSSSTNISEMDLTICNTQP